MRALLASLLAVLSLAGCAGQSPKQCAAQTPEQARAIAVAALGPEEAGGAPFQLKDRGPYWLVGYWFEPHTEGDIVASGFGGRSLQVDKCSGRTSQRQAWR